MFDIENCPAEAWNYEFIVCEVCDDRLIYNGCCRSAYNAEEMARNLNYGVVIHNVRIQGYRDPHPIKRFIFSGRWYWDCFAHNLEEAKQKYCEEVDPDELHFDSYDDISEEECKSAADFDDSTGRRMLHDY